MHHINKAFVLLFLPFCVWYFCEPATAPVHRWKMQWACGIFFFLGIIVVMLP